MKTTCLIMLGLLSMSCLAEDRVWTDLRSNTITGILINEVGSTVTIRTPDGKTVSVGEDKLSDSDRQFLHPKMAIQMKSPQLVQEEKAKADMKQGGEDVRLFIGGASGTECYAYRQHRKVVKEGWQGNGKHEWVNEDTCILVYGLPATLVYQSVWTGTIYNAGVERDPRGLSANIPAYATSPEQAALMLKKNAH